MIILYPTDSVIVWVRRSGEPKCSHPLLNNPVPFTGYTQNMEPLTIKIQVEDRECLPAYATENASGMDLKAYEDCCLAPGERRAVRTGIRLAIPEGYEAQVRPRSGLALQKGLSIPNAPGTIDSDYRGEVKVILINLGTEPVVIKKGERIAQMVICPVTKAQWEVVPQLPQTERGDGGFGSTGTL